MAQLYFRNWKRSVENPERKRQLAGIGVDGRMILKWIVKTQDIWVWIKLITFTISTSGGLF
jgi:hypothetical protein